VQRSWIWWPTLSARTRTAARILVLIAGFGLGVVAELANVGHAGIADLVVDLAVGLLFLVGGVTAWQSRPDNRVGPLMVATSLTWFAGGVLHRGPLTQLLLGYPTGHLSGRLAASFVVFAYVDAGVESFVVVPFAGSLWAIGLAAFALQRVLASAGPVRRGRVSPAAAALAITIVVAGGALANTTGSQFNHGQLLAYDVLLAATALGLVADLHWGGWAEAAVTGLVVDLGDRDEAGTLRDRLGEALGDRSLEIGYWIAESAGYMDDAGRQLMLPAVGSGRRITPIEVGDEPLAVLIHDQAVLSDPALLDSVATAARIAVTNARLQAEIRTSVAEVDASRRRIVQAADLQRQRIEHELTAGPMTRIERVGEMLHELRSTVDPDGTAGAAFAGAESELQNAAGELQRFAQGVYPIELTKEGLAPAVVALARRSATPVTIRIDVGRLPTPIETTAYFVCSEGLANIAKHAEASQVEILATTRDGWLRLLVVDNGVGGANPAGSGLRGLADRVAAVGGRLRVVTPPEGGTRLEADLPLA
jgi:signal transduction histidine kinase